MACETPRSDPHTLDAGTWESLFATDKGYREDIPFVDVKRDVNTDFDGLDVFLRDSEDAVPSRAAEVIKAFCGDLALEDLRSGSGNAGKRPAAWVDDRRRPRRHAEHGSPSTQLSHLEQGACSASPPSPRHTNSCDFSLPKTDEAKRSYPNKLTATNLYEVLKERRYGIGDKPDVDRRLLYISHLDPYYVLALTETTPFHQVQSLQGAIWRHLAKQTSIKVELDTTGYPVYQLGFSLPYFLIRPRPQQKGKRPQRDWIDLSFLNGGAQKVYPEGYGILEAHFSFVICGSDNLRWTAYAFSDEDEEEEGEEEEEEDELGVEGIPESRFAGDPIASDGLDADIPIWNVKEYFIKVVENRMNRVLRWWEYLVQGIEPSIKQRVRAYSSQESWLSSASVDRTDLKEALCWTQQAIKLLRQLHDVLSQTLKAWEKFRASSGDVAYFSDLKESSPRTSFAPPPIYTLNKTFANLESLQENLSRLEKVCQDLAKELQLRLTHESNEAARFSVIVAKVSLVLAATAVVLGYFTLPRNLMAFEPNSITVVISIILAVIGVRLTFALLGTTRDTTWFWRMIGTCMRTRQSEGINIRLPMRNWYLLALKRGRRHTVEDIEMTAG